MVLRRIPILQILNKSLRAIVTQRYSTIIWRLVRSFIFNYLFILYGGECVCMCVSIVVSQQLVGVGSLDFLQAPLSSNSGS